MLSSDSSLMATGFEVEDFLLFLLLSFDSPSVFGVGGAVPLEGTLKSESSAVPAVLS